MLAVKHKMEKVQKGWIRLGIVISLAWMIGVASFTAFEYKSTIDDFASAVASMKDEQFQIVGQDGFLFNCSVKTGNPSCNLKIGNFLLILVAPVLTGWAFQLLCGLYCGFVMGLKGIAPNKSLVWTADSRRTVSTLGSNIWGSS